MATLRPDEVHLTPVSTAPASLMGPHSCNRRKTSLPALFLHRKLSHTPSGDGAPPVAAHHLANGGVGHALKRIKKVVFASISHVHHESEPCPVPTILPPESPSPVRPGGGGGGGGSAGGASPPAATSDKESSQAPAVREAAAVTRADAALLRISPGRDRERHSTERSVDSRSEMDFYLDSDDEESNSRNSTLLGQGKAGHSARRPGGCDSLVVIVSALYCKLLVVIGLAFPLSEVISSNIPPFYYEVFYIYLYSCSILFLLYVYIFLLKDTTMAESGSTSKLSRLSSASMSRIGRLLRMDSRTSNGDPETASQVSRSSQHKPYMVLVASYGSFYLRMGAVLFGIGSMIYSGLEMGQYFEVTHSAECSSVLRAVTPGLRLTFIFIQMYFVFLNASMSINKHKLLARFGLMHMVGTNLCVWLNVVIQETKHELVHLLSLYETGGNHTGDHHDRHRRGAGSSHTATGHVAATVLHDVEVEFNSDLEQFHQQQADDGPLRQCARSDIMGNLVDSASPFLFPCTIEYSLICAATLYVMWKNLNKLNTVYVMRDVSFSLSGEKSKKHQYSVDCARASKGLFLGILVLVASIISLILFFVLINKHGFKQMAILSASMTELVLYCVTILAIIVGMMQIQRLRYRSERSIELDNILLVVAQTGVYLYASFNIIGSHFSNDLTSLGTSVMAIAQVTMQTMFILDASCRQAYKTNQLRDKPGREVVTFLLICNLALWSIHVFETSRSDAHPHQLHFFGFWAWTIISHVSMPLAIFYRFHSTVCLCEIWKRAYKYKPESV